MTTDITRWSALRDSDAPPSWYGRNILLKDFIPENVSVLDIGSGNQSLKHLLPPSCSYHAVDCVEGDGVVVIDFNAVDTTNIRLPRTYDIAVCSGVMEYIHDTHNFFNFVFNHASNVIFTYVPAELRTDRDNTSNGWVDGLSTDELIAVLNEFGMEVIHTTKFRRHSIMLIVPKNSDSHSFVL